MGKAKRIVLAAAILVLLGGMAMLNGHSMAAEEKFKVGFIYIGPVGDAGWTLAHDEGAKVHGEGAPVRGERVH